jgi:ABC-2 type transport system permease protein
MITNFVRTTLSVAWKDLQVIFKDRGLVFVIIGLPLIMSVFYGYLNQKAFAATEGITFPVAVVNLDQDVYGNQIVKILENINVLEITMENSLTSAEAQVRESKVLAAIILPAGLSKNVNNYQPSEVQVMIDPTQRQLASTITAIMQDVLSPVVVQGEVSYAIRTLLSEIPEFQQADPKTQNALAMQSYGVQMAQVQKMQSDPWIGLEMTSTTQNKNTVVIPKNIFALFAPGFVVMFTFFIVGAMGKTILEERQEGTLRRLMAAPVMRWSIILGKMLAYVSLSLIQVFLIFGISNAAFDMPVGRSLLGLILVSIAMGLAATSMGMMIASLSKTDKQADTIGTLQGFVLGALGGCIVMGSPVPLYNQGGTIETISRLTPHAHALIAYGKLINQNMGLVDVLPQVGILLLFTLVFLLIAVWRFKFE